MDLQIARTSLDEILDLRALYLHENNFQFVHNKCHDYGWSDDYLFMIGGVKVGYGCVWGDEKREVRDTIFEYYILPSYRMLASKIFVVFRDTVKVPNMEAQSNNAFQSAILFEFAAQIKAWAILFEDRKTTQLSKEDTRVEDRSKESDRHREWKYALFQGDEEVATGGLLLNYNKPYADVYMDVKESRRQEGFGSLMVQELKQAAYRQGRIPAARCNPDNKISKATLLRAGFGVCGAILIGKVL